MNAEAYMRRAIDLAEKGRGWTAPNPVVGAVIVKNGQIIGEGYHQTYGGLHAERNALASCRESPAGADLYVTLEPCCHHGKTPPCTDALLEAGIGRVFIGAADPNPLVSGKGVQILRKAGVSVQEGVLQEACAEQNRIFFHYIRTGTPWVVLKYAMTLDGKIAAVTGKSRWITGEAAREHVHRMRHELTGIMVGSGTVLTDNPSLDCRIAGLKNPVRIVCDTTLSVPPDALVIQSAAAQRTILATACTDTERLKPYLAAGCEILPVIKDGAHLNLKQLMKALGRQGIDSILLEGGAGLHWAALASGIADEVCAYIAPKLFGGADAKTPVGGAGVASPAEAFRLEKQTVTDIGGDLLIRGIIARNGKGETSCLPES